MLPHTGRDRKCMFLKEIYDNESGGRYSNNGSDGGSLHAHSCENAAVWLSQGTIANDYGVIKFS